MRLGKDKIFKLLIICIINLNGTYDLFAQLKINEIVSNNSKGLKDADQDYSDWIEVLNTSRSAINLSEYYLSDDLNHLYKWRLPQVSLEPDSFLVFFASGKDRLTFGQYHTNFKIKSEGEDLILSNSSGVMVDKLGVVKLMENVSYGRFPDGSETWQKFWSPTPFKSNNLATPLISVKPSHVSGVYTILPIIELTASDPNAVILYTTDLTKPNLESQAYSNPIDLNKHEKNASIISNIPTTPLHPWDTNVTSLGYFRWQQPINLRNLKQLNYASFLNGQRTSPVYSLTIFPDIRNTHGSSIPKLHLITDSLSFYDYEKGIYIPGKTFETEPSGWWPTGNYHKRGPDWERPAELSLYNESGEWEWTQNVGVRIRGFGSAVMPQKSLNVYFRKEYGDNDIDYSLFKSSPIQKYKRFVIRNSGSDFRLTHFKDAFLQTLVAGLDIDRQRVQVVSFYVNGEYWGIQNVREKLDQFYVSTHYNVEPEDVVIVSSCGVQEEGDDTDYDNLLAFVESADLSNDQVYQEVAKQIDINSFIDYHITEIYFANYDWPCNNKKFWKTTAPDSKWRPLLYDLDASFGDGELNSADYNSLLHATDTTNKWPFCSCSSLIFRKLLKNDDFKEQFVSRFTYHLKTTFNPLNVLRQLDSFESIYKPYMRQHISRWGYPSSLEAWKVNIDKFRTFAINRPCYMAEHLKEFFGLERLSFECLNPDYFILKQANGYSVYPNPSSGDKLVISHSDFEDKASFNLLDLSGRNVMQGEFTQIPKFIYLEKNLSKGLYFLIISDRNGLETHKVIIDF